MVSMCRQIGLALGAATVAAVMGTHADLSSFHAAWFFMAACGLTGGLALLAIRDNSPRPVAAAAGSPAPQ